MAKRKELGTTVHLIDPETGQSEVWGPGRKLSAADIKRLGWPKDHESIVESDEDEMDQEQAIREGHPFADGGPVGNLSEEEEAAAKLREATRELESRDEGVVNREGLNASQVRSHPIDEVVEQGGKSVRAKRAEAKGDD